MIVERCFDVCIVVIRCRVDVRIGERDEFRVVY